MQSFLERVKKDPSKLMPLLPLIAFVIPLFWLYILDPLSFENMWKGRTFQLFFVWLIALELILGWENFKETKLKKASFIRNIAVAVTMIIPTIYVWASYYLGLNDAIIKWSFANNLQSSWATAMPLSLEYIAFALIFSLTIFLVFGKKGLSGFIIPFFFMIIVGIIYIIDNVYPYGQFTLFQVFVPTTAWVASIVFNLMGYHTFLSEQSDLTHGTMPILNVSGPQGATQFGIAWPCAGIESLLIFTVVVLLFLKRMPISWKAKVGYFAIGAIVTYLINILRIVNIFMIGMQYGAISTEVDMFHRYYGPLYSITWIILYPLVIFVSQGLWHRFKIKKIQQPKTSADSLVPKPV